MESIKVELESGKGVFDLKGEIQPDMEFHMNDYRAIERVINAVTTRHQQFGEVKERGGNYIVIGKRGSQFVLHRDIALDWITVTTGMIKDIIREDRRLLPSPTATRESFDAVTSDFSDLMQEFVEEYYARSGLGKQTPPDEELVLRPPKQKLERDEHWDNGMKRGTPEELLGKLEIERPDVTFEQIGGQNEAKREVQGLAFALKNPELYKKWGTRPPKGILLYGPPGTGKTLMAKALASQAEARFFHVQASDIASKWYGESEQIVRQIFELANHNGDKTIVFFDELDAIAPDREGTHEATHKVISTILEAMDGLESNENVMVVASTNRLNSIDPALVRAGRFDRWVEVTLPDEEGRKQILEIHMAKAQEVAGRTLFADVNLDIIVPKTEKSSGADLAEIVRRALEEKVRQEGTGVETGPVTTEDILREIQGYERTREVRKSIGFRPPQTEAKEQPQSS
jgi:SpoVK/Ycf46/Vps4 family AAA+-type ATPase